MAEGVITGYGVGTRIGGGGSDANDRKRAREDRYSPGPSTKRQTRPTVKKEKRIQALQVSRVNHSVNHSILRRA